MTEGIAELFDIKKFEGYVNNASSVYLTYMVAVRYKMMSGINATQDLYTQHKWSPTKGWRHKDWIYLESGTDMWSL